VKIELAIVSASKATIAKDRMKTTTRFSFRGQQWEGQVGCQIQSTCFQQDTAINAEILSPEGRMCHSEATNLPVIVLEWKIQDEAPRQETKALEVQLKPMPC
jgi:hypothetical protein